MWLYQGDLEAFASLLFKLFGIYSNAELDALEADMGMETESDGVPSYLQPDKESDLDAEFNLPSAPTGHAPAPGSRTNAQVTSFSFQTTELLFFCLISEVTSF